MPTVIDTMATNSAVSSLGDGVGGYYGQTFSAAGPALTEIQFQWASHTGQTDYKVHIMTWVDGHAG